MARTFKARSLCVDNVAVGSAMGVERTIDGAAAPTFTATWGNAEKIATGTAYGADENLVVSGTNLLAVERRTA
jgi:hypothetical protein